MQNFPHILSEYEEINSLLYKPINSTQRIKYTCFNTSTNYIVLGSTSGSLYLFSREPCSFLQLIPLSEGAVLHVAISPDEKTIALTTTRGTACLVTLKPVAKLIAVSTEHVNQQINSICWNDNSSEVYIGDGTGKVSVMVLSIFAVNGMFQAPACVLMQLDSWIVQMSFASSLLLVSTLTRCYICNTVKEQYKQIGNKTRNGEFGACFYKSNTSQSNSTQVTEQEERLVNRMRSFSLMPEEDNNLQEESQLKIFCARPSSRIWEVSSNGIVLKTHQFKEALAIPPVAICKPSMDVSVGETEIQEPWPPQSVNFAHLFILAEKYLFSYTSGRLYIINPATASVVLWCNEFSNINMAEATENKIYLMTTDGEFHCLSLSALDTLAGWLFNRKRYRDCLNLCLSYKSHLSKLIGDTEMRRICDTESELSMLRDEDLTTILNPLIQLLQSNVNNCPIKLNSGIVVVNSGNLDLKGEEGYRYKSTMKTQVPLENVELSKKNYKDDSKTSSDALEPNDESRKQKESDKVNCNTIELSNEVADAEEMDPVRDPNQNVTKRIQSDLEDIYSLANDIKPSMSERKLEIILVGVQEKLKMIKESYEMEIELKGFVYEVMHSAELYFFTMLLENTARQLIDTTNSNEILKQMTKAFTEINTQTSIKYCCKYACPMNELTEPKFLTIGKSLLRKFSDNVENCINICNKVPYMWREYFPIYVKKKFELNDTILRQCLQTRDTLVLANLLPHLDAKQWSTLIPWLTEIREGRCLFCGNSIGKTMDHDVISWSNVAREIAKQQGPDVALEFLTKVERLIPNLSLDASVFQSLIFTKILHQHGMKQAIDFDKADIGPSEYSTMCSRQLRVQLAEVLEKDVGKSVKESSFGNGSHHWGMRYRNKSSTCPCCTLSLQTPVLLGTNGIAIFCCGHAYHVNCMIEKKLTTCILHS